jgi:hypothetical protein
MTVKGCELYKDCKVKVLGKDVYRMWSKTPGEIPKLTALYVPKVEEYWTKDKIKEFKNDYGTEGF